MIQFTHVIFNDRGDPSVSDIFSQDVAGGAPYMLVLGGLVQEAQNMDVKAMRVCRLAFRWRAVSIGRSRRRPTVTEAKKWRPAHTRAMVSRKWNPNQISRSST